LRGSHDEGGLVPHGEGDVEPHPPRHPLLLDWGREDVTKKG
jgi:hypothetical protein